MLVQRPRGKPGISAGGCGKAGISTGGCAKAGIAPGHGEVGFVG